MGSENQRLDARRALATLGLTSDAGLEEVRRAFRGRVMADHPDRPGGDAQRFNEALLAYRFLQAKFQAAGVTAKAPTPAAPVSVTITPKEAFTGGERRLPTQGQPDRVVTLPAGLRDGDRLRVGDDVYEVHIRNRSELRADGDDLHLTVNAPSDLMHNGGRLAIQTPAGPRHIYVARQSGPVICLNGQGLPATRSHARGSLYVHLFANRDRPADLEPSPDPDTPAQEKRRRFAKTWAA
jgi:curved DNA-binding protein